MLTKKGKIRFNLLMAILIICAFSITITPLSKDKAYAAVQATYYVSTTGSDSNSGTLSQPFATIQKARDVVRASKGTMTGDIIVYIRGGKYFQSSAISFNENDSGNSGYQVKYLNYPGETPQIIGGTAITGWTLDSGNIYKVYLPTVASGSWKFNQLFENGVRSTMARYPKNGYLQIENYVTGFSTTKFTYKPGDLPTWTSVSGAQVNVWAQYNWYNSTVPITSIDTATRTITLANAAFGDLSTNSRYFIQGVKEALTSPGEFYLNTTTGFLYYWPINSPIANQEIVAPTTQDVIIVQGTSSSALVSNITFEGLTVSDSEFTDYFMEDTTFHPIPRPENRHGLFYLENANNISIRFCELKNAGFNGIVLNNYAQYNQIYGNEIQGAGFHGVLATGPNPVSTTNYINKFNTISNNIIHGDGKLARNGGGIFIIESGDNTITHNQIYDQPRYGIAAKGLDLNSLVYYGVSATFANHWDYNYTRNNYIAYNDVYGVNYDSEDAGGISLWGTGLNNVIDNNKIHDITTVGRGYGLYLDDDVDYTTVKNNIIYSIHGASGSDLVGPIFAKGVYNTITNNILVGQSGDTFGIASMTLANERADNHTYTKNIIYFKTSGIPIYNFLNWSDDRVAVSDYNIFYQPSGTYNMSGVPYGNAYSTWTTILTNKYDQHSSTTDPLFVDAANDDYTLQSSSPAFAKGFVQINQSGIGLLSDNPFKLPPQIVWNDDNSAISYVGGTWSVYNGSYYHGDQHFTSTTTTGSYYQFIFNGTKAQIYAEKSSSSGKADVYVDNVYQTTLDLYMAGGAYQNQLYYDTGTLTSGNHTVKIAPLGQKNASSSGYWVGLDSVVVTVGTLTLGAGTANDNNTAISYVGGPWTVSNDPSYYLSDQHFTSTTTSGSYYQFTFTGTKAQIYGEKSYAAGKADVYVDSVYQTTLDLYQLGTSENQLYYDTGTLTSGSHTVKIAPLGQKNASSSGYWVGLDSVVVIP